MTTVEVDSTRTEALSRQPQENPTALSANLIDAITRAAKDPSVDVDKMSKLLEMHMRMVAVAAEASFNQAFARLQPRLPRITKSGAIILKDGKTKIAYAKYSDIWDAVGGLLAEEGFSVSYSSELVSTGSLLKITVTLRHIDGHHSDGSVFLPLTDDSGAKNRVQGSGSIYAYGKRYSLSQLLNIITEDEDDDGMRGAGFPIDEKKVSRILDLIADIKDSGKAFNDDGFLKLMKVTRIEDITNGQYETAIAALNQKRSSNK